MGSNDSGWGMGDWGAMTAGVGDFTSSFSQMVDQANKVRPVLHAGSRCR